MCIPRWLHIKHCVKHHVCLLRYVCVDPFGFDWCNSIWSLSLRDLKIHWWLVPIIQHTAEPMAILSLIDHAVPLWLRSDDATCEACCAAGEPMCSALPANTRLSDVYCHLAVEIPAIWQKHSSTNIMDWYILLGRRHKYFSIQLELAEMFYTCFTSQPKTETIGKMIRWAESKAAWRSCCIQETSTQGWWHSLTYYIDLHWSSGVHSKSHRCTVYIYIHMWFSLIPLESFRYSNTLHVLCTSLYRISMRIYIYIYVQ